MRNIILSFDDGCRDFYTVAYPILKKYDLTATVNIITQHTKYAEETDENSRYMTVENLLELEKNGIEIACHGRSHENTIQDITDNIDDFKKMGISVESIGFASPGSGITMENVSSIDLLVKNNTISYIRSAFTPYKYGRFMVFLNNFMEKSQSKKLFYLLNKKNFIKEFDYPLFPSVVITSYTTMKQLKYLLSKMPDNTSVIIMFHHIYRKTDKGYGKSVWFWDADLLCEFCEYIKKENFNCIRNIELI